MSENTDNIRAWFTIEHVTDPDSLDISEFLVTTKGVSAGRGAQVDIRLSGREISRRHFHIYWSDDEKFVIEDLGSSNGIQLNDIRLTPNIPAELRENDIIRVGPYLIRFMGYIYGTLAPVVEDKLDRSENDLLPPIKPIDVYHLPGIPRNRSTWMDYLPAIFSEDEFLARYLLIFESINSPLVWTIDNFDLFLDPTTAPTEWLQWLASWFDILLLQDLPIERQRQIMAQIGWLYKRRGTPMALSRIIELYYGIVPEIIEDEACHFIVKIRVSDIKTDTAMAFDPEVASRLILSQKPAFASFALEVE